MSYYNTIRLLKGTAFLTTREYKNFEPGDTIWGNDSDAEEISRWNEDEKEKALDALKKYKCSYQESNGMYDIEEFTFSFKHKEKCPTSRKFGDRRLIGQGFLYPRMDTYILCSNSMEMSIFSNSNLLPFCKRNSVSITVY